MNSARMQEIRSIYKKSISFLYTSDEHSKTAVAQENEHICPHKNLLTGRDQR